jgi:3-hydroxyisobutyrate dehydrogenase
MGGGIAANLIKAGHKVGAFDLSAGPTDLAQGNGCVIVPTASETVAVVDSAVPMLRNGNIVESVHSANVIGIVARAALTSRTSTDIL